MLSLLQPDETANALYRRLNKASFCLKLGANATEELYFAENVEVIAQKPEVTEFVLSAAMDFASQVPDGFILHVSIDNSFHQALFLSGMDISSTPLYELHLKGRLKALQVAHISQLLALCEFIKANFNTEKVLVILEGLSLILLSQKSPHGTLSPTSLVSSTLTEFQKLCQLRHVTCLWVNAAMPKGGGGLREGNFRDPVSVLWKQKMSKVYQFYSASR